MRGAGRAIGIGVATVALAVAVMQTGIGARSVHAQADPATRALLFLQSQQSAADG